MRRLLLTLAAVLAAATGASAQTWGTGHLIGSASLPGSGTAVAVSISPNIGAGDLLVIMGYANVDSYVVSTDNSGTYITGFPCHANSTANGGTFCGYILSAGAENTTLNLTMAQAPTGGIVVVYDQPYTPGSMTLGYDGANASLVTSSVGSITAAPFLTSGTNDISFHFVHTGVSASSISAPFTADRTGSSWGFAHYFQNPTISTGPTLWAAPTWTLSGADTVQIDVQIQFGFNVVSCANMGALTWAGSDGTQITAALLQNGMLGYKGFYAHSNGTAANMTFSTTYSHPFTNVTGRMCDGNSNADFSTTGFKWTDTQSTWWDFGAANGYMPNPKLSVVFPYVSNYDPANTSNLDVGTIHGYNGTTDDFDNAMDAYNSGGGGTLRQLNQECHLHGNQKVHDLTPGTLYMIALLFDGTSGSASHYVYLYDPSTTPWTLLGSSSCASSGIHPSRLLIGDNNSNATVTGKPVGFGVALYSMDGTWPLTLPMFPACPGSQPNYYACSTSSSDVTTALGHATHCDDIVNIPPGSSSWASQVSYAMPTGCSPGHGATIKGATYCNGYPGLKVTGCTDNTTFTDAVASNIPVFQITGVSNTSFLDISGLTLHSNSATTLHGFLNIAGTENGGTSTPPTVGLHHHYMHFLADSPNGSGSGGDFLITAETYGLVDHTYCELEVASGQRKNCFYVYGDSHTFGAYDWELSQATPQLFENFNQMMFEDDYEYTLYNSAEGFIDGGNGCAYTVRYTFINGDQLGGYHGTDSGYGRSCLGAAHYYDTLLYTAGSTYSVYNTRGGATIAENLGVVGVGHWKAISLQYYRVLGQASSQSYGTALAGGGINWTPISSDITNILSDVYTVNASLGNWQANHTYNTGDVIGPTSGNAGINGSVPGAGGFNYYAISGGMSGGSAPTWNQTFGCAPSSPAACEVTDGGVTWLNIGGGTGSSGGGAGYLSTGYDTPCASGVTCTRYADTSGGVYPYRDQPGIIGGQTIWGNYHCNNTLPADLSEATFMGTNSDTSTIIVSGRDYFNACAEASKGWAAPVYPDPLQGGTTQADTPTFDPGTESHSGSLTVTISSTSGTVLCHGTGSSPATNGDGATCASGSAITTNSGTNCVASSTVCGDITVSTTQTQYAVAGSATLTDSNTANATYTILTSTQASGVAPGVGLAKDTAIKPRHKR